MGTYVGISIRSHFADFNDANFLWPIFRIWIWVGWRFICQSFRSFVFGKFLLFGENSIVELQKKIFKHTS